MVAIDIFNLFFAGLSSTFGYNWISAVLISLIIFIILYIISEEIILSFLLSTSPVSMYIIFGYLYVGWAVGLFVIAYGYLLFITIKKVISK